MVTNLRICHMIPGFFPITKGGAEVFAFNLCKKLQSRGFDVRILTRNLRSPKEEIFHGLRVRRFSNILPHKIKYYGFGRFLRSKYIRILVAIFDILSAIPASLRLYKKESIHLFHTSFILPFGLVGWIVKKFFKVKLIITVHGPADFYEVPPFFNPILRFILKRADAVVAVSPKLVFDLNKRLGKLPAKLICNGILLKPYKSLGKQNFFPKYNISQEDFVILTAGRLIKRKNLDILIKSVPKMLEKIPQYKLVILGSGIERENLRHLIKDLKVRQSVVMPGWIPEKEKVKLMKRADIFVQLSEVEGLSLALLESKAAGVPAIAIGQKGDINPIIDGKSGLIISPPITIDKIVSRIEYLSQNPDLYSNIRENIKKEARLRYSLKQMVENYIQLYRAVLKR